MGQSSYGGYLDSVEDSEEWSTKQANKQKQPQESEQVD